MTQAAEQLRISDSVILMELADAVRTINDNLEKSADDLVDVTATFSIVSEFTKLAKFTGAAERNPHEFVSALAGDRTPAFEASL